MPTEDIPEGASLLTKMALSGEMAKPAFLQFLTQDDLMALRSTSVCHRDQIGPPQYGQMMRLQLESKKSASLADLRAYKKLTGIDLASPTILHLDLSSPHLGEREFIAYLGCFPNLQSLEINQGQLLPKNALESIADHFPHLQSLSVLGKSIAGRNARQGDPRHKSASLRYLADRCPDLQRFSMGSIVECTDDDFKYVVDRWRDLQHICLEFCFNQPNLTDDALRYLADQRPNLLSLQLLHLQGRGRYPFSTNAFEYLAHQCQNLQILGIH